jgi:hypothetical protein
MTIPAARSKCWKSVASGRPVASRSLKNSSVLTRRFVATTTQTHQLYRTMPASPRNWARKIRTP